MLETIAGVPGMVAGMWIHLRSLRQMKTGYGPTIRELLAEAENERMHLMFFIDIAKPNALERALILAAQAIFWNYYFVFYVFFPKNGAQDDSLLRRRGSEQLHAVFGND